MSLWNNWPTSKPRQLIEKVFRVIHFDRNETTIDNFGNLHAKSRIKPYGYLKVESPILKQNIDLPIIHRDDFLLATFFFDDSNLIELSKKKEVELLVTYAPAQADKRGFCLSPLHSLHYALCQYGTLEKYYSNSRKTLDYDPRLIFGPFIYEGEISIHQNLNPKL